MIYIYKVGYNSRNKQISVSSIRGIKRRFIEIIAIYERHSVQVILSILRNNTYLTKRREVLFLLLKSPITEISFEPTIS